MRRIARGARTPENSIPARLAVLAAAAVANLAMAATAGAMLTAAGCLVMVAAGHLVSWRGRHKPRTTAGQALLALLVVLCIVYLVSDLTLGLFGGALPQAKFAVMVQAVTSFDLKSRRNLFTHLWHSAVILYVGSLFAWSPTFLPFVLGWAGCLFAFMYCTRREAAVGPRPRLLRWTAGWIVLSGLLFLVTPHFAGRPIAVPLLVSIPLADTANAEVLPSILPLVGSAPGPGETAINLRVRGRLGEEVMFRVRSPASAYWRAYTLGDYRGQSWSRLQHSARSLPPINTHLQVGDEGPVAGGLPQTYFIERSLPAEILVAYPVSELYFPARGLALVSTGTVHSPVPMRRGINYSAVSAVRNLSVRRLRQAEPLDPGSHAEDLALPRELPGRVGALARELAAPQATEFDRVQAITNYLRSHYRYTLDTPRLPSGADAVDRFLFVDRVGYCEQFASALAVMLRSVGIPSRMAVGYSTGDRDSLTGSFTVRARDAHAWVEVLFPGVGWVPFDASPGYFSLPANRTPERWLLSDLSPQIPFSAFAGAPGGVAGASAGLAGAVLLATIIAVLRRSRRRGRNGAVRAYLWSQRWLRWGGLPIRAPAQTPAEHLAYLRSRAPDVGAALAPVTEALEASSFAGSVVVRRSSLGVAAATLRNRLTVRRARPGVR